MGPMTRKTAGWEIRLHERIEDARGRPFVWGTHDCLTWSADVMAALIGGQSLADDWRGRYKTELGARRLLKRKGFSAHCDAVTAHLGPALPAPAFAQRGDLVAGPADEIGICIGSQAAFIGPEGLYARALTKCATAWRI